jgi:hypothetical protein
MRVSDELNGRRPQQDILGRSEMGRLLHISYGLAG